MRPVSLALLAGCGVLILAGAAAAADHAFIGAEKCKMCHNSAAKGVQFTKWAESKHAKAYQILGTEAARKIAAAKGITDPQKAPGCLRCHVTGHGAAATLLKDKYKVEDGVSCESCHGAGGDYWSMAIMKDRAKAVAAGLVIPSEATCRTCHNSESPTFKGFDYAAMSARVAHPNPARATAK